MKKEIKAAAEAKSESVSDHGWWREVDVIDFALSQVREQIKKDAEIAKNMIGARRREIAEAILAQIEEDSRDG